MASPLTWSLFIASILLKLGDVITTLIGVSTYGTEIEFNFILKEAMEYFGVETALFLSWVGVCLITYYGISRLPRRKWIAPAITCAICLPVVINNIYQLRLI